jgi:hypothetical protein
MIAGARQSPHPRINPGVAQARGERGAEQDVIEAHAGVSLPRLSQVVPEGADWAALATDLGFTDQAHFVRTFKAFVGIPPAEYARRLETTLRPGCRESARAARVTSWPPGHHGVAGGITTLPPW